MDQEYIINNYEELTKTWAALNTNLKKINDKELIKTMMTMEFTNKNRKSFVLRCHSRFNYLRAMDERNYLMTTKSRKLSDSVLFR